MEVAHGAALAFEWVALRQRQCKDSHLCCLARRAAWHGVLPAGVCSAWSSPGRAWSLPGQACRGSRRWSGQRAALGLRRPWSADGAAALRGARRSGCTGLLPGPGTGAALSRGGLVRGALGEVPWVTFSRCPCCRDAALPCWGLSCGKGCFWPVFLRVCSEQT